jgi:hypothetical protein
MSDDLTPPHGLEYLPDREVYRTRYTDCTDAPSAVVVKAVAAVDDRGVGELDPLFDVVDPEALDALFEPTRRGGQRDAGTVAFPYHGYEIRVRADGTIEIDRTPGNE